MTHDAFVAASDLTGVEVTGQDRASFLHNVLSQDVIGLGSGEVAGALYLDAHGSPLAVMDVVVANDRHLLLVPGVDAARSLAETLGGRTFLADARFEVLEHATAALRGPDGAHVAHAAGVAADPGRCRELDGILIVGRRDGVDLLGPESELSPLVDACVGHGARRGTEEDVASWQIARGVPRWAHEIRPPHLPEEMGLLPSHVHLQKGCYPGQEAVARMWMLGRPRRRLARVILEGAATAGWRAGEGRDAVEVTGDTDRDGVRVGLAYVPSGASPGDQYGDEAGRVIVREIVGADAEVPGHDPSVQRRRDQRRGADT